MLSIRYILILLFIIRCFHGLNAQNQSTADYTGIQNLLDQGKTQEAQKKLAHRLSFFHAQKNYDSLVKYIPLVGSFELSNNNPKLAINKAEVFVEKIEKSKESHIIVDALIALSNLYFNARYHQKNYEASKKAVQIARSSIGVEKSKISALEGNMGTALLYLRNNVDAQKHFYRAKHILEAHGIIDVEQFYNVYNNLGRVHANLVRLDSSIYYYEKALKVLDDLQDGDPDVYYRRAIVKNNLALNFQNIGKTEKGIQYIQETISDFQTYIDNGEDESKKLRATRNRLVTIDNLGTFFYGIGEYKRAIDLIDYSYKQKLAYLNNNDADIVFSLVILGEAHLYARNYEEAVNFLDKALVIIDSNPQGLAYLNSYTQMLRASLAEAMEDFTKAQFFYEKGEAILNEKFKGVYLREELSSFITMSLFYAKVGNKERAIKLAKQAYDYTNRTNFQNQLVKFYHTQNMAEVNFILKDYQQSLEYSEKALSSFKSGNLDADNKSDSIQITYHKPKSILINAQSRYYLKSNKSEAFLKQLLEYTLSGVAILEQRKTALKSVDDIKLLIAENNDFFKFLKRLYLDLHALKTDDANLKKLIAIHESSIYNRIRARLNIKQNLSFLDVPKEVLEREKMLRDELSSSLDQKEIESFFNTDKAWGTFLDSLRRAYPKYYKMRYATIEEPLDQLQKQIPSKTTLVRYLFIENELYAYVADATHEKLVHLNFNRKNNKIQLLSKYEKPIAVIADASQELYEQLWKPLAQLVKTEKVIIFPDAELFNLSFDLLCPTKIKSYKDFATQSLLAKHSISYNYSLLLLHEDRKTVDYSNDFIAFAPEFNDNMKGDYELAITDSINLDKTYLTLLPQPFSSDLVKKFSKRFKGSSFLNANATKPVFTTSAKEHKIIHIGTHAESNNVSPELSRLIFAKNTNGEANLEDNSLFTYEIYNHDFSSNLAILTACETGKPTYQSGEGMISLAHAFNYAGSESILTSLWMIDEKASASIVASFYEYVADGFAKDEALKKAKLDYIIKAPEDTVSPQYWAGLILMGDAEPIAIARSVSPFVFAAEIVIILLVVGFLYLRKKNAGKAFNV